VFLKKGRNGDCGNAENSREVSGISEETIPEGHKQETAKACGRR